MATSLQALLDSVVDKLDPLKKIPYHAELYSAGLRTPDAIKAVRTPREVMEAAEIPFDDASTIWTAAGGGTGYTDQLVGLGGRNEGVVSRMANGYFTRRTETCRSVLTMLQQLGVVMMYAPPHSGKTSLCQLVTNMARASSVFQQVYHFGCAAASNTDESFQTQFRSMCGVTFDKAAQQASASNRTVIVIDEAQRFDKTAGCVWGWAKLILSTPTDIMRLMILIALSHGSTPLPSLGYTACPVEFSATRSIRIRRSAGDQPALHFTDSEFTEVFNSFCQRKKLQPASVQVIKDYIGSMSEKHPGLVLHMLDGLDDIKDYADNPLQFVTHAQDMLLGQTFISNLENVPSFMSSQAIINLGAQHDLLEKLLFKLKVLPYELPHQEQEVAKQLTKAGHLVTEPSQADLGALVVTFVSKLHVDYTRFCFYRASSSTVAQMPTSMSDFLRLVLQRMGFVQMANPLNNSKRPSSRLSLAQFHNDFYRFSISGKLHELLTQGHMAQYAVLDMHSNDTQPTLHHHTNLYHVLVANDFKSAELRVGGEAPATLYLGA